MFDTANRESSASPRFMRAWRYVHIVLLLLCMTPSLAMSQQTPPYAIQGGLNLGLDIAQTSAWDVELSPRNAPRSTPRSTISEATGLGLTASYGVTAWLAPWISYVASLYGESDASAISETAAGLEFRGQWFRRLVPSVSFGLGRTSVPTAGGFSFTHADLAAGAEFFLSRRLALRAGLHGLSPLGEASGATDNGDASFMVSEGRTQLRLGVRVHLGPGG